MNQAGSLIRTPDQRLRVFVSSTLRELAPERRAVRATIERLALAPVMFELGARPHPPRSLYRAYLEQSDVFVGMYGESYGWVAPGEDVSGLEDEYDLAPDIPMLIYVKAGEQRQPRLEALLDRIRADDRASYVSFTTTTELRRLLTSDLAILLAERFEAGGRRGGPLLEPTPSAASTALINPPAPVTRLIGRERELALVTGLLTDQERRLVTITGPGGVGKTRLALAAARELETSYPDGVAFVDLAPIHEPELVVEAIASALGIRDTGDGPLLDKVLGALGDRRMLVLLDNAEQVVGAAPDLSRILSRTRASLLVTSRTLLRIAGEQSVPLHSLQRGAALDLFAERARSVRPDFEIGEQNSEDVAAICTAVDNLPLALELAAARIRVLSPAEIRERLNHALALLVDGDRDRPERQRTLRATIDWSTDLLGTDERVVLRRIGAFRSGFALDAAEWMCDDLGEGTTLESLSGLIDGSLVREHDRGSRAWYTMLATVREHAREWLIEADELEVCREKHSAYYMRLAVTAERELRGPRQQEWLSRLVDEFNELRAAAEYLLSKERWDDAVNLVWPLYWFWWIGGRLTEVAGWMQQVVDRGADASERSKYIAQTEVLSIGLWRHPDPSIIGALKECAEFFHRDGDAFSESFALSGLGVLQLVSVPPDLDAAEDSLERAFAAADSLGDPFGSAMVGLMRGRVHLMRGNPAEAIKRLEEGLAFGRMTGDRLVISTALAERGWAAFLTGDMRRADECFREQLLISSTIGHEEGVGYGLEGLFSVAATAGDIGRGGLLLGAADSIRQRKGNSGATMVSFHLPVVKQLEDSPLAADFAAARATGREMDQAAAVELALS